MQCADREEAVSESVWVWGVPFTPMTLSETVAAVGRLVAARKPAYFITANTHYVMLTAENPDLSAVNQQAAFIVADGAPLVWASRWQRSPLPERVAGSDLIFEVCAKAAEESYRIFLLGGASGVAEEAARRLQTRYTNLQIVGVECPPFRELSPGEQTALVTHIRSVRPDIVFVAFGQPKGERWIYRNLAELDVPVCVQVGASLDFAAGRVRRAPRWMQIAGLEWAFRLALEPRRLFIRYARNAWFILRMVVCDLTRASRRPQVLHSSPPSNISSP